MTLGAFVRRNFSKREYVHNLNQEGSSGPHTGMLHASFEKVKYFLLCGSQGRSFDILKPHDGNISAISPPAFVEKRGLLWGVYSTEDEEGPYRVGVITTGMGPASTAIVLHTDFLPRAGNNLTMIRVGTGGTMHADLRAGDLAIATEALRIEDVTDKCLFPSYSRSAFSRRSFVPRATPNVIAALEVAAHDNSLRYKIGPKITKNNLEWEIGNTPWSVGAKRAARLQREGGIIVSSMESSVIYTLGSLYEAGLIDARNEARQVCVGSVLAVVNDPPQDGEEALFTPDEERIAEAEEQAIVVGREALSYMHRFDVGNAIFENAEQHEAYQEARHKRLQKLQRRIRRTNGMWTF